ncbi:MAG: hypothetical protein LBK71_02905 [Verrucomicrobiales bacterium]|jgi:hypothetical protein|nr:hypothetical protein [Verrucomicrobiales bacterium]
MDKTLQTFIEQISGRGGSFGIGALFGAGLSYILYRLASSERREMINNDQRRMDEIVRQSGDKDRRIENLHTENAQLKLRLHQGTGELPLQ